MTDALVRDYLSRLGLSSPRPADRDSLCDLQARHLLSVPFENLSIHLGEAVPLDEDALLDKIVRRRRGGFCYELNGAFAVLLATLGYRVTHLAARVYGGGTLGPPFDHLVLRVDLDEPWLVDVGFGRFSRYPLRLDLPDAQHDPGGVFRLVALPNGDIDVYHDDEPQYRLEPHPRALSDFEPTCWYHQTSPRSHFTWSPVCSLETEAGRITLSDRTLIVTEGDDRRERNFAGDAELLAAYREYFGIVLNRIPEALHPRID